MADAALNIKIGADVQNALTGIKSVEAASAGLNKVVKETEERFVIQNNALNKSVGYMRQQEVAAKALADAERNLSATTKVASIGLTDVGDGAKNALGPLNDAYQAIRRIAYVLPGIGVAGIVGLLGEGLEKLAELLIDFGKAATSTNDILEKTDKNFESAAANVYELQENVKLAKEGFLNQDQVVKEYNDTLGKTLGRVSTLGEVENKLAQQGDNYIKFTLLKAAANVAYAKAADEAFKVALDSQKKTQEFQSILTNLSVFGQGASSAPGFVPGIDPTQGFKQRQDAAERAKKALIAEGLDTEKKLLDIGNDFQKQAAEIAAKNNFNFFQDNKPIKPTKIKIEVEPEFTPKAEPVDLKDFLNVENFDPAKAIAPIQKKLNKFGGIKLDVIAGFNQQEVKDLDFKAQQVANGLNKIFANAGKEGAIGLASTIGSAIGSGANILNAAFEGLLSFLGEGVEAIGKQLIVIGSIATVAATAIKNLLKSPELAIAAGVLFVVAGSALKASASKIHAFADGGIVTGPTNALIGEAGPEVVFPLEQLNRFVRSATGASNRNVNVTGEISGNNLKLVLARTNKNQGFAS